MKLCNARMYNKNSSIQLIGFRKHLMNQYVVLLTAVKSSGPWFKFKFSWTGLWFSSSLFSLSMSGGSWKFSQVRSTHASSKNNSMLWKIPIITSEFFSFWVCMASLCNFVVNGASLKNWTGEWLFDAGDIGGKHGTCPNCGSTLKLDAKPTPIYKMLIWRSNAQVITPVLIIDCHVYLYTWIFRMIVAVVGGRLMIMYGRRVGTIARVPRHEVWPCSGGAWPQALVMIAIVGAAAAATGNRHECAVVVHCPIRKTSWNLLCWNAVLRASSLPILVSWRIDRVVPMSY